MSKNIKWNIKRNSQVSKDLVEDVRPSVNFVKSICPHAYSKLEEAMKEAGINISDLEDALEETDGLETKEELAEIITDNIELANEENMEQANTIAERYMELCNVYFKKTNSKLSSDILSVDICDI